MTDRVPHRQNRVDDKTQCQRNGSGPHHDTDIVENLCSCDPRHHIRTGRNRGAAIPEIDAAHQYAGGNQRIHASASGKRHKNDTHRPGDSEGCSQRIAEQTGQKERNDQKRRRRDNLNPVVHKNRNRAAHSPGCCDETDHTHHLNDDERFPGSADSHSAEFPQRISPVQPHSRERRQTCKQREDHRGSADQSGDHTSHKNTKRNQKIHFSLLRQNSY